MEEKMTPEQNRKPDPNMKKLMGALDDMRRNKEAMVDHIQLMAYFKKEKYDALVAQGFTKEQAIELCKDRNVFE